MNINNDTNVVVLTGQVSKIQAASSGQNYVLELGLVVRKKIKTGVKLNHFKIVFFDENAVDVERCVVVGDSISVVGELDESTHYTGTEVARETRVAGRHVNLPGLEF